MTRVTLAWWGGIWLCAVAVAGVALSRAFSLRRTGPGIGTVVTSDYRLGKRVGRRLVDANCSTLVIADGQGRGVTRISEEIVDAGPILGRDRTLFGVSFAPAKDGLRVQYNGQVALLTVDDLLQLRAYDARLKLGKLTISLGADRDKAVAALADELKVRPEELIERGRFSRIALRRCRPVSSRDPDLSPRELDASIIAAGGYLARQLDADGGYRYEVDPFTGENLPGYSWPRHAGATFYLAQAANHSRLTHLAQAARLAASRMTAVALQKCGTRRCVGDGDEVNVGSAALALLAFVELVESGIGRMYRPLVLELADFIRSQQRPDGEFMHRFDIKKSQPIDEQLPYFSGEAAFALSRAQRITQDPRDLEAAGRALAYLTLRPRWALGMRYLWAAEHWTCQAMEDLWQRSPDRNALEFCMTWQEYNRSDMLDDGEDDGAVVPGAYLPIRYTSSGSRMEAAVATLNAAKMANLPKARIEELEAGIRRTLRFLMRVQFLPGPIHLMPRPHDVHGGFPGGNVDYNVRIDYPQHAAAALLRYRRFKFPTAPPSDFQGLI